MATRHATTAKRRQLSDALRAGCTSGTLRPGQMVPTMRELQDTYELSSRVVHQELRKLVDEGLLVSRSRVGIFVAEREVANPDTYVMTIAADLGTFAWPEAIGRAQTGFEDQITELGGASIVLPTDSPALLTGRIPTVAGIFAAGARDLGELRGVVPDEVPRVRWQTMPAPPGGPAPLDTVAPDHVGAGRRATDHLVARGHERVAFVGLHGAPRRGHWPHHWSGQCRDGWEQSMAEHGHSIAGLSFEAAIPTERISLQPQQLAEAARPLVARPDITGVVCASSTAAEGLAVALEAAGTPVAQWPTLVTIGVTSTMPSGFTTTIRMPYEELGRAAARLLWQRTHGELSGPSQHVVVPMPMVRRADLGHEWLAAATG